MSYNPTKVEGYYHPCTHILIEGLKRLEGGTAVLAEWDRARAQVDAALAQQPAAVDGAKETDLWRCTVCGRVGTVGRCCGEETREPFRPTAMDKAIPG